MPEVLPEQIRTLVLEILQRVIDDLHFYADETEMGRLPALGGAGSLRLAAALLSIQRELI